MTRGSGPKARDTYLQYLESDPGNPAARSDLGVCHRQLGDFGKAIEELDRVLAAHPEHWQSLYNKIVILGFDLDKKAEARTLLPKLRQLSSDEAVEKLAAALKEE